MRSLFTRNAEGQLALNREVVRPDQPSHAGMKYGELWPIHNPFDTSEETGLFIVLDNDDAEDEEHTPDYDVLSSNSAIADLVEALALAEVA